MTTSPVDHVVTDYLKRLEAAAASLPPARRMELLQEIREHIEAARAAGAAADEATVRTMLDRLGEPEDIVAAALESSPDAEPVRVVEQPSTGLELAAALLLTVGSFIPLIGWAVGAVLLWGSRRWSTREKLLGTLVVPGGPGMALWLGLFFPGQTCVYTDGSAGTTDTECSGFSLSPWIGVPLFLAILIAPFIVAGLLYSRARSRAEAEEPVLRPARSVTAANTVWTGQEIAAVWLLAAGALLAVVGALVLGGVLGLVISLVVLTIGLVLMWTSGRWTQRQKAVSMAIGVTPGVLVAIVIAVYAATDGSDLRIALASPLLAIMSIGVAAAAIYLTVALNQRRP